MFARRLFKDSSARPVFSRGWWTLGILKSALAFVLVGMPAVYVVDHYRIVHNRVRDFHCVPYDWFFIDLSDRSVGRGDYVWFRSKQMEPFYANGTHVVKIVMAVPGDRVRVDARGVWVNSVFKGRLYHAERGGQLAKLGHRPIDYFRDEIVPLHHLWVMGTSLNSFDSRYWGFISDEQVLSRAHPLW